MEYLGVSRSFSEFLGVSQSFSEFLGVSRSFSEFLGVSQSILWYTFLILNNYCTINKIYRFKNEYIIEKILEISKSFKKLREN